MPPRVPSPSRVPRPRLADRARRALEAGSLVLVAGAGAGKSTLLEETLRGQPHPVAWVSCSERERDPGGLLVAVLDALGRAVPGSTGLLAERLDTGERLDVRGAGRWLVGDLDRVLVEPVVLVLDDAERLGSSGGAVALAGGLVGAGSPRLRVALATRRPLELGAAPADTLGEADLTFTAEECAALLRERLGREPGDREVASALATSLGWPLGLALGAPARADFAAFLEEELLAPLDPALRDALIDSAVVDELAPAVLEALGAPADLPARAAAIGLPLRPVARRPGVLAHHPLVRQHLRLRLARERTPAQRRDLLARVAAPLAADGRSLEAVEAWLDAERWPEALETVARDLPALLSTAPETLRGWLARLPVAVRDEPVARLLAGRLAYAEGDHATAAGELRRAEPALRSPVARLTARLVLGECLFWLGELEALAGRTDDGDLPRGDPLDPLRATILAWTAQGQAALGEGEGARRTLDLVRRAGPEIASLHGGPLAALIAAPAGTTDQALDLLDTRLAAARSGRPFERPELDLALAALLLADQGRVDAALARAERLVGDTEGMGARPFMQGVAYVLRAWLLATAGRAEEAELALAPVGRPQADLWPLAYVDGAHAMVADARGRVGEAVEAAEAALARVARAPLAYRTLLTLGLVPVLARAGREDRARAVLAAALTELDARLPGRDGALHRARLRAVRAWLHDRDGELDAAGAELAGALADVDGAAAHLVRASWPLIARTAWTALEREAVDSTALLDALEGAFPASEPLLELAGHPSAAVRRRVVPAVAASGHPQAASRLGELTGDPDPAVAAAARRTLDRVRAEPPPRSFTLLGGFALRRGEYLVEEPAWERPMALRLVRFLVVHRGTLVPEELLLEAFWPGKPARSARSSLQVSVSRARAVLDGPGAERSAIVLAERAYRLVLDDRDRVDVDAFELAATTALAERGPARRAMLERAIAWWTGEPLPEDRYADWASEWRERLVRRYIAVLGALLDLQLAAGEHPAAVEVAHRALDAEPLDEGMHRALMVAYARQGRRGRALRQFLECRRALVDALGVEPSAETAAVQQRLLAGEAV